MKQKTFRVAFPDIGEQDITAWLFPPEQEARRNPWALCVPGATYRGLAYYDRQVTGYAEDDFSMARYLASKGVGCVVIDNLGAGDSPFVGDAMAITPDVLAAGYAELAQTVRMYVGAARLFGIGHSMGAFIQLLMQVDHMAYNGVALLGLPMGKGNVASATQRIAGGDLAHFRDVSTQLMAATSNAEVAALRPALRRYFYDEKTPPRLVMEDEDDATTVPPAVYAAMFHTDFSVYARRTTAPVFLGYGEQEIQSIEEEKALWENADSVLTSVVPGASHCANFAPQRLDLWTTLDMWIHQLT